MEDTEKHKEWIKVNKQKVIDHFCSGIEQSESPLAIFMCGSSGAGKTEEARRLKEHFEKKGTNPHFVHIDQDIVKGMIPGYSGENADMFQGAASIGVDKILDYCYKKKLHFILDSTFSRYPKAQKNIARAIKQKRRIFIIYIYQDPEVTWNFVENRRKVEKRKVPIDAFANSYFGAFKTIKKIKEEYKTKVLLTVVNKDTGKQYMNVTGVDSYVKMKYSNSKNLIKKLTEGNNKIT